MTDVVKERVAAHWNRRTPSFDEDFGHSIRTAAERAAWDRGGALIALSQKPQRVFTTGRKCARDLTARNVGAPGRERPSLHSSSRPLQDRSHSPKDLLPRPPKARAELSAAAAPVLSRLSPK